MNATLNNPLARAKARVACPLPQLTADDLYEEHPAYGIPTIIGNRSEWIPHHRTMYDILHKIAEALNRLGENTQVVFPVRIFNHARSTWDSPPRLVGIHDINITIDAEETRYSQWRSTPTGKFAVVIGDFGDKKRFPSTKTGHSYDKIAAEIVRRMQQREAEMKLARVKAAAKNNNAESVAVLKAEFGIQDYDDKVCASYWHKDPYGKRGVECVAPSGHVYVKLGTMTLTEEQARAALQFFADMKGAKK